MPTGGGPTAVTTAAVESATVVGTATGTVGTVTATGGPTVVGTATRTVGTVATAVVSTTVVATAVVSLTGGGGTVAAVGAVFARLADGAGADTGAAKRSPSRLRFRVSEQVSCLHCISPVLLRLCENLGSWPQARAAGASFIFLGVEKLMGEKKKVVYKQRPGLVTRLVDPVAV